MLNFEVKNAAKVRKSRARNFTFKVVKFPAIFITYSILNLAYFKI